MAAPALEIAAARSAAGGSDPMLRVMLRTINIPIETVCSSTVFTDMKQHPAATNYILFIRGAMSWGRIVEMLTSGYDMAIRASESPAEKCRVLEILGMLENAILTHYSM